MQTVNGFGVEIVGNEVLYQCPNCNPVKPYNLGSFQKLLYIGDQDNDGLADILGVRWECPSCQVSVSVPYEDDPQFDWGKTLKEIFKQKEMVLQNVTVTFTGLNVVLEGTPEYLDDDFILVSHETVDKKFKICFAINDSNEYDLYITTQLQDDITDWGVLPVGWLALDCIMTGTIKAGAVDIQDSDVKHILDPSKVVGIQPSY